MSNFDDVPIAAPNQDRFGFDPFAVAISDCIHPLNHLTVKFPCHGLRCCAKKKQERRFHFCGRGVQPPTISDLHLAKPPLRCCTSSKTFAKSTQYGQGQICISRDKDETALAELALVADASTPQLGALINLREGTHFNGTRHTCWTWQLT